MKTPETESAPCSPVDWDAVRWRRLEEGEEVKEGDYSDACADGWNDEPRWEKLVGVIPGNFAPANYPAQTDHETNPRRKTIMSDTPETDEIALVLRNYQRTAAHIEWEGHARQIERERDHARAEAERWRYNWKNGRTMSMIVSTELPWEITRTHHQ